MDLGTIIGILSGSALILTSLSIGSGGIGSFINVPSILVVMGGTAAAILIMFPLKSVLGTIKVAGNAFTVKLQSPEKTIKKLVQFAEIVRKESILGLEKVKIDDAFLKRGIRLCVDGSDPKTIKKVLEIEMSKVKERHGLGQQIFEQLGAMAPAFGMIGTLIGLVQMLQNLTEPAAIGPAMAVALLTTFYGAVMANLVFIPIAKKLEIRSKDECHVKEIMIEGVTSIAKQDNPRSLKDKLDVFLAPTPKKGKRKG